MILQYDNLIGLEFKHGEQDCYSIVRDFYKQNFGLEFPNYARPTDWWNHDLDLYMQRYFKNGFRPIDVHPSEYQPGDLFLMSIMSQVTNHAAILVEKGQILHHFTSRRSAVEPYKGIWRNCTTAVLRHKDVHYEQEVVQLELLDVLPENIRRKIDAQLKTS